MSFRQQSRFPISSEQIPIPFLCYARWFLVARGVHRFMDHPVESSVRLWLRVFGSVVRFAFLVTVALFLLLFAML